MEGTRIRLEEYASSGLVAESEDASDALCRIKVRPPRQRKASHATQHASVHRASASHRHNDRYLEAFDPPVQDSSVPNVAQTKPQRPGSERSRPKPLPSSSAANTTRDQLSVDPVVEELSPAWTQGPRAPEGKVHSVSAQPLLCMGMSRDETEVVVGSSDHALYVISVGTARVRTLYSKQYGHTEWVTCLAPLADGRILSGGMDSKICLWDATGGKCTHLLGHTGSVSCVLRLDDDRAVSTGYDKMVRLWNVGRRRSPHPRDISVLQAGTAPILELAFLFRGQHGVCGDRDGGVQVLDFQANQVLRQHLRAHTGHTTSVFGSQNEDAASLYYSGGQDGMVQGWDMRQKDAIVSLALHLDPRKHTKGAVGFIRAPVEDPTKLLTAGADGLIHVVDKRQAFRVLYSFTEHSDFIYSFHLRGPLCLSGAGNGMLHVHDWQTGNLLYGLGANQAAVRAIATSSNHLVAAGDDGHVIVYDMT